MAKIATWHNTGYKGEDVKPARTVANKILDLLQERNLTIGQCELVLTIVVGCIEKMIVDKVTTGDFLNRHNRLAGLADHDDASYDF